MASSSSWLTALLERPAEEAASPAPLSWLPDLAGDDTGFVEGAPFNRPTPQPEHPLQSEDRDHAEEMIGDELVDILREALGETAENQEQHEADSSSEPLPKTDLEDEPEDDLDPDPIAEAFMRGKLTAREEMAEEQARLSAQKLQLRQTFRALDQAAMDALANDLAETVIELCSQCLADFNPAPDALKGRCLEAAQRLGSAATGATLYLHPDDLLLIDKSGLDGWTIVGDPNAERGGLRFETKDGSISDGPADWRRAIAAAIRG